MNVSRTNAKGILAGYRLSQTNKYLILFKVGKAELAASKILDVLEIPHVRYEEASNEELGAIAKGTEWINKINQSLNLSSGCAILKPVAKFVCLSFANISRVFETFHS